MFKKSFTLIELLVVISIISILTSLLLPSLASAKGKAQQAACSSNLKQVGMGFLLYTDDYDGCLAPYSSVPPATIPHWYWADMFIEYFDTSAKRSQIPGTDSVGDIGLEQNWMTYSRLMDCPTADRPGEYEYT